MATTEQAPTSVPARAERQVSSESSNGSTFSRQKRFELADLLRDCAALVEQNEMQQATFQKMFRELTDYVSGHGGGKVADMSGPTPPSSERSFQRPFDEDISALPRAQETAPPDPPTQTAPPSAPPTLRPVTTTTTHIPPPPPPPKVPTVQPLMQKIPSSSSRSEKRDESSLSKEKSVNFLDTIKKNVKDIGQEFTQIAHTARTEAQKKASSAKNALRARNELGAGLNGDDWCEEHFTMGCTCKLQKRQNATKVAGQPDRSAAETPRPINPKKPPFQRPVNPNSTLIANGWMEQQRRSKMRFVWKEVLVSLVAGRKPGEETTLWVQREITNANGQTALEALHQIPIKGMQDVSYVDFSSDHRFIVQVYNLSDEFVFRTRDNGDAAKNWVSTLRLTREAIINGVPPPKPGDLQAASKRTKTYPGFSEDEKKAESPPQQQQATPQQYSPPPQPGKRLSVSELRAIAHGNGINTAGMERGELEAIVAKINAQQNAGGRATPQPPPGPPPPSAQRQPCSSDELNNTNPFDEDMSERETSRRKDHEMKMREAERRAQQLKLDEETAARMAAEERAEVERQRMVAEQQRQAQAAAEERRRAEYLRQQEIHRQQQAQAAAWHEEQRRAQAAAEEQRRYQQQQYYAQQQAQWQQQQRQAQQQQWNQQHPGQQMPHTQGRHFPGHQTPPPGHLPHPGQGPHAQPPPGQTGGTNAFRNSQVNQKWANQASEELADSGPASIAAIKHHILIHWALAPPSMQMLRPIEALLTSIHGVFPPTTGVPGHDYFTKWKPLTMEIISEEGRPDENKLGKAVKKLRFFLHPDKLPRDLSEEQSFVCKMLWDITSDAWEEYQKRKEDLDWLNQS